MLNKCKSLDSIPSTAKTINKKNQIIISLKSSKSHLLLLGKSPVHPVGMVRAYMIWSLLSSPAIITCTFYHSSCKALQCLEGRACSPLWSFIQEVSPAKNTLFIFTLPGPLFHISNLHLEDLLGSQD